MMVVLMGVSGSGKTTIGTLLARETGAAFADADDYHPEANKLKMASGQSLTDEDRQPWLERLNLVLRDWKEAGQSGVLACSALKDKYRAILSAGLPEGSVLFVWLDGSRELIAERLAQRHHEFMNPGLLDSQLATLEPPANAVHIINDRSPEEVVAEILKRASVSL